MLRFAPSLAEELSVEDLRIVIISWMVARQSDTGFLLRMEEVNADHHAPSQEGEIRQILEKFALPHDQLLYQAEALHRHQQLAITLLEQGKAFVCTCTPTATEEKHAERPSQCNGQCEHRSTEDLKRIQDESIPYVLRLKRPREPIALEDIIQGTLTASPEEIDRFVILDSDGKPTRDFMCAVDDMLSNITMALEHQKDWLHTARRIHIHQQLGYDQPIAYAHLAALAAPENLGTIKELFWEGFLPDTILNALLLVGYEAPMECFTLPEALEWFDLARLSPDASSLEEEMLRSLNRAHIRRMDDKAASALYGFADADIGKLVKLHLEDASTLRELDTCIKPFFAPKPCEGKWGASMKRIAALIPDTPVFRTLAELESYLVEQTGLSDGALRTPLRRLLSGSESGPDLGEIYPLIQSYLLEVARCPQ